MDVEQLLDLEFADAGDPRCSYLICSVPRSGSNLLCELLAATGLAGAPTELFHPDYMRKLKRRWGAETTHEYVAQLLARKTGPNGVFGLKAHWLQYERAVGDEHPRELFPGLRLIYINRRDHLRQAVSWARAEQTTRWRSSQPVQARPPRESFDAVQITRLLDRIARVEELWAQLFTRIGIAPHAIAYEDFVADREHAVRALLDHLGVEPPPGFRVTAPTLEPQSDALTEQWLQQFRAETGRDGV